MYASAASVRANEIQNGVQCFSISCLHQTPWFPRGMHAHILPVSDCRIALLLSTRPADEEIECLFVATPVTIPKYILFFFILDYGQRLSLNFLFNRSLPPP
jgi:hypothetical protein